MAANETLKLRDEGVDINTALEAGAVSGVANAAGFMIAPALGATRAASAAWGAGSNIALNVAEIAGIHTLLNHANYKSIAAQYQPLDPTNIIVSGLLGSAFGAAFHKGKVDPVLTPDEHAAALTMNEAYTRNNDTLTHPDDVNSLNAATDAQALARQQLDGGEMVSVADGINIDHATVKDRIASISDDLMSIAGNRMTRGERLLLEQQKSDLEYKLKQIEDSDYTQQGLDSAAEHQALLDADNAGRLATTGHREPARKLADQRKAMQESATALGEAVRQEDMQPHHDSLSRLNEMLVKDDEARAAHSEISRLEQQHLLDNGFIQHPEVKPLYEAALQNEVQSATNNIQPLGADNPAPTQTLDALVNQPAKVEAAAVVDGEPLAVTPDAITTGSQTEQEINANKKIISALMPFNIQGNKSHLLAKGLGELLNTAMQTSKRLIDAFAGAGTYAHYLANSGATKNKSVIVNEYEPLRFITHQQIRDNPEQVIERVNHHHQAIAAMMKDIQSGDNFEDAKLDKAKIAQYLRDQLNAHEVLGQKKVKCKIIELDNNPDVAALYYIAQNVRFGYRPIQSEANAGLKINLLADAENEFLRNKKGKVQKYARSKDRMQSPNDYITGGSGRLQGSDVRRGDGWALAKQAQEGDLVLIDTSYLNKTDAKGKTKKTSNYNEATEEDAIPEVYQQKITDNLLDAWDRGAKLVITNNWDEGVAQFLKQQGFTILSDTRAKGVTDDTRELIAINFDSATGVINPRRKNIQDTTAGRAVEAVNHGRNEDIVPTGGEPVAQGAHQESGTLHGAGRGDGIAKTDTPEITSAREALSSMDASRQIEIPNDDGTVDTGTASELMARADEDMAFAEQSDAATTSAISCFLKFGGL